MLDAKALATATALILRERIEKEIGPLVNDIAELTQRPNPGSIDDIKGLVAIMISDAEVLRTPAPAGADGQDGRDGKDADEEAIKSALTDHIDAVVKAEVERATASTEPNISIEDKASILAGMLRKEIGDSPLVELPVITPVMKSESRPTVMKVENHMPKRGVEKTIVTKHDERGRILEFERHEIGG